MNTLLAIRYVTLEWTTLCLLIERVPVLSSEPTSSVGVSITEAMSNTNNAPSNTYVRGVKPSLSSEKKLSLSRSGTIAAGRSRSEDKMSHDFSSEDKKLKDIRDNEGKKTLRSSLRMGSMSLEDASLDPNSPHRKPSNTDIDFNLSAQTSPTGRREERMRQLRQFTLTKHHSVMNLLSTPPSDDFTNLPGEGSPPTSPGLGLGVVVSTGKEKLKKSRSISNNSKSVRWNKLSIRKVLGNDNTKPKEFVETLRKNAQLPEEVVDMLRDLSQAIEKEPIKWVNKFLEEDGMGTLLTIFTDSPTEDHSMDILKQKMALTCIRIVISRDDCQDVRKYLGISGSRSSLLKTVVAQIEHEDLRINVLDVLNEFFLFPTGYLYVTGALQEYAQNHGKMNQFEVLSRIMRAGDNQCTVFCMCILSTLLNNLEDNRLRQTVRSQLLELNLNSLTADMRDNRDTEVQLQLDILEQSMDELKELAEEEHLDSKDAYPVFGDNNSHLLKVLVFNGGRGSTCVVPYSDTTTVKDVVSSVKRLYPAGSLEGQSLVFLSTWMDESKFIMKDYNIKGEQILEMKQQWWNVTIRFEDGGQSPEMVSLDPNTTTVDAVATILKKYPDRDSEDADFGLCVRANADRVTWFGDSSRLSQYQTLIEENKNVLDMARKPPVVTVTFTDEKPPLVLEANGERPVKEFIASIAFKLNPNSMKQFAQFAIGIKQDEGKYMWLDGDSKLSQYTKKKGNITVLYAPHPRPKIASIYINADMNNPEHLQGPHEEKEIFFANHVSQILNEIHEALQLPGVSSEYDMQVMESGKVISLLPWAPLYDQIGPTTTTIYISKNENINAQSEQDDINIWDESSPKDVLKTTEGGFTLNELVIQLTSDTNEGFDMSYLKTFLSTFESFCTQEKLLKKLWERFKIPDSLEFPEEKKNLIRMRVCTCLKHWLSTTQQIHPQVMSNISHMIETDVASFNQLDSIRARLKKSIANKLNKPGEGHKYLTPPPDIIPLVPPKEGKEGREGGILDIADAMEIARQLTLRTFDLYSSIKPIELFNQAWSRPKLQHLAPNVINLINTFNYTANWVATAVVNEKKLKHRRNRFCQVVRLAECLKELQNYHLLTAVISGLNHSSTLRLKWTRGSLPKRVEASLANLEKLTSMESSFKYARQAVDMAVPPCVPYIGTYLMDLTFIDETPDFVTPGRINFEKRKLVYKILSRIEQNQTIGYNLQRSKMLSDILEQLPQTSDSKLYEMSLLAEPRNATAKSLI
ncbi:hypothetical protein PROFUN_04387 [Planoprotostelium fungivorum]|uniref:Ras guanine nucleotide exchange factor n=1 Tax=Planoprotostelium fungivorum TaxID=1890364 RepID=A0A2P6NHS6_9EUKA|nr:hypothetical protein PROFUN_04387 [Planoprotostelium fungivorum]